jgi:thiol-disulfide isomerase/thioredoxin
MPRTILSLAILLLLAIPARAGDKKPVDLVAVTRLVKQGDLLTAENKLNSAMKLYKKADKLAHHTCSVCYLRMSDLRKREGDLPAARHEADKALKAAGANKQQAAEALLARGVLYAQMATGAKDNRLKKSEADLRQVLQLEPSRSIVHFSLGVVLVRENRDAEGIAELKTYVALPDAYPRVRAQARRIIADPASANEPSLPQFAVLTLKGRTLTTRALSGKVVLLDFWGTWCEPCRDAVPMLADLRKRYAGRPLEIVSISSDTSAPQWKQFIAKHHMDWPQTLDSSRQMQLLFGIHAFPTYILADREGVVVLQKVGMNNFTESQLEAAIDKALRQPQPPPASNPGAH